ncbi:hypothetical protein KO488_05570 [Poseidonibacter lekithochrous]|uniref:Spy/CpxP family protein refolding chaperone n=1 Tax=Poseidonibacter TaxID=2321187 RepID=UPI001C0A62CF|nr:MULTISPECIES: hypothetical protein [Poseidonibacter]MBU3014219.1 hypothetical protein [Poseidonibacter lekithochrous]MDO6827516.1 hypothetical protein [Poseidonibacter sp. 1_MG-2023]
MKILKVLIVLCSLSLLSSSFADDDYEEHYEKNHIYRSLKYLDLKKEQNTKIRDILIEYKKDYQKYLDLLYSKRLNLQKIMQSETFDKEKYIKISNEINMYFIEIEADKFNKIHGVLTPKQRVKFSYFLGEKHSD